MSITAYPCVGAIDHSPRYFETDRHHTFPRYLCALLGIASRPETVRLCAQCHDSAHHVIHHLINSGTWGGHRLPAGTRAQVMAAWSWWQAAV